MAFRPKTFEQILNDMINYVRANTHLSDFNPGSVIRTILESCALEDDAQFFQMVQLLDSFSFELASGQSLDERAQDFDLFRNPATNAAGRVIIANGNLVMSPLAVDAHIGDAYLYLSDTSSFTTTGTVNIGEGTSFEESVDYTANDTVNNKLTVDVLTPLTMDHTRGYFEESDGLTPAKYRGTFVALVTGGATTFSGGFSVQRPPSIYYSSAQYTVQENGTFDAGSYYAYQTADPTKSYFTVIATASGSDGNSPPDRVTQIVSGGPSGGVVYNEDAISGGEDVETDEYFRARIRQKIFALAKCNKKAIDTEVIGVTYGTQRVLKSKFVEDLSTIGDNKLYIDDGTSFVPTTELVVSETIIAAASGGEEYAQLDNWPIVEGSLKLYIGGVLQTLNTDYYFNHGSGHIQFVTPLTAGVAVTAGNGIENGYRYYTGLVKSVQYVVNGDPDDYLNYPGLKAAGVKVLVTTPSIRNFSCRISIAVEDGITEANMYPLVQNTVALYVNSLNIGEDFIVSEAIQRIMEIPGMYDVEFVTPTDNIPVLDDELLRIDSLEDDVIVG